MTLILFDVDGTLTATNAVDAACYAAAFGRTFGFPLPTTDWDVYRHCTDTGIIHEVVEERHGRPATQDEVDAFERAFVEELSAVYGTNPGGFREIPGAKAILEAIVSRPGMRPVIATGGMRGSACYKLSRIGVDALAYAAGFANDSTTREGIARCAIGRCGGESEDVDLVYVGDGPWDVRTSASVGMRFVGITGDAPADPLLALGATVCLNDYGDQERFFAAVAAAQTPLNHKARRI